MKTCKSGCGKMKAGGTIKKVKKMAVGGQALNKAKGFAKPTTGGDNVSKKIYGVPNAGPTGPNRQGIDTMKKGGTAKAKFGASVSVKHSCKAPLVRDASGKCVMVRKMAKGGFPDLTGDGKVTKADVLKGRGVIKRKGGSTKK